MLRSEDQRGFTLVELSVAMTLMLLVSGALLAALESGTTAERHASMRIDDEQSVRVVLAQFTHDVRNASSLPWIAPGISDHEVDLEVAGQHIRWWYDAAGHILHRQIDSGGTYNAGIALGGLINPPGTTFALLASDATPLLVPGFGPDDALRCATTVHVSLTALAHPPSKPFTETADAPVNAVVDRRGCP